MIIFVCMDILFTYICNIYIYLHMYVCIVVCVCVCVQCYFTFRAAGKSLKLCPKFPSVCCKELLWWIWEVFPSWISAVPKNIVNLPTLSSCFLMILSHPLCIKQRMFKAFLFYSNSNMFFRWNNIYYLLSCLVFNNSTVNKSEKTVNT